MATLASSRLAEIARLFTLDSKLLLDIASLLFLLHVQKRKMGRKLRIWPRPGRARVHYFCAGAFWNSARSRSSCPRKPTAGPAFAGGGSVVSAFSVTSIAFAASPERK